MSRLLTEMSPTSTCSNVPPVNFTSVSSANVSPPTSSFSTSNRMPSASR